nr:filamentous hemagglutinin N-terminal domain-containing protein [Roseibium sediminis]
MGKLIYKLISWVLIGALVVQPTLLHAQSITVEGPDNGPRPRVDESYNGTPVLNINTPNAAGVSHDIYTEFTAEDLILNNSATNVDTQIGGWIEGNPNLAPGQAARLWIGEVIGGNQTQLNGILEVAGQSMDVVLANEFGITCNGCGFVNTGRTTLTTGKPIFGANGSLAGFDVKQGTVTIGSRGLNPESRLSLADTSRVDVIARAAAVYGAMRADQLNIVAGANRVNYDWSYNPETGEVTGITEQTGTGAAPALAIDVAALGGMYANAIQMVATENGVGVRLDGEMASSSNIAIRSDGRLTLGAPSGGHTPLIKARKKIQVRNQGPIVLEGSITSEDGDLIDIRTSSGALTFNGQADGGAITLESAGMANISGAIRASGDLKIASTADAVILGATSEVSAGSLDIDAAGNVSLFGKSSSQGHVAIDAGGTVSQAVASKLSAGSLAVSAATIDLDGTTTASALASLTSTSGGITLDGTLSGGNVSLVSATDITNTGIVSAADQLVATAVGTITNAATIISANDLALYADKILNAGGVIWANDSIILAKTDALDAASLVQNTNGRIEAFQGDLTIRAKEVANIGTAPTLDTSTITKWLEKGSTGPVEPVSQLAKLIDPAYLDANGKILPEYADEYAALWADLVNGASSLSADGKSILKTSVLTASGTAIKDDFAGVWKDMYAKAKADGETDPAGLVASMVDDQWFDPTGKIKPEAAEAFAELWETLASGGTAVSDTVKGILKTEALVTETITNTDNTTSSVLTNNLVSDNTDVWAAMTAGSGAAYDIIKILYQDRFNDDGVLAEIVAGGTLSIVAENVKNHFANMSAGENLEITANTVDNKALGASQFLVEVHKRPDCFTCHEGKVEYYDTFGGRIEAVGNVNISGSLTNTTLQSSTLTLNEVIGKLNAFIAEKQAEGDTDLQGVAPVASNNAEIHEERHDDEIAPVAGNGTDIRTVELENTGSTTDVNTAPTVNPTITATASVDALLAAGLNTIAETNPEFTDYANFITSRYILEVDRDEYLDEIMLNTNETIHAALSRGEVIGGPGDLAWLDQPISVPSRDGAGTTTVHPSQSPFQLASSGALISGENVTISGSDLTNSGTIVASLNANITVNNLTDQGGRLAADAGELALTALGSIKLDRTRIDAQTLDVIAGQDFTGKGVSIDVETDASIFAIAGVTLTSATHEFEGKRGNATFEATQQTLSSLEVGGNLSIISSADIVLAGLEADIGGDTTLSASRDLLMTAVQSSAKVSSGDHKNGTNLESSISHVTNLSTGGDFTALAGGQAVLVGTQIDAGGKAKLSATGDVILAAAQDIYSFSQRKSKKRFLSSKSSSHSINKVTNKGVRIAGGGDVEVLSDLGDLVTAGTAFASGNGDISLSATEGNIYAGTYTDIFQEEYKKSRSFLFGLISASSQLNTIDRYNTGTAALAALDLSLVSGADTTLVGANLSAGQNLNINTGGDFSVQAAIDSQRQEFFSSDMGPVVMTTIQESSFVETAVFTKLLAGQGINLDIGGKALLTVYTQAGVDAPSLSDLYPEELLALEGLQLLQEDLANEYFYEETVQMSPAFKALVSIAIGAFVAPYLVGSLATAISGAISSATGITSGSLLSGITGGLEAFTSTFLVESLDAAVSGDFDLGDILKDAVFSGVSAGLTSGIGLETFGINKDTNPALFEGLLGNFGNNSLSLGNILDGAIDGAISSGLSSAVYGTDFLEGFSSSMLNTMVNLTLADVQYEIGELGVIRDANGDLIETNKAWEGSLPHALLHGLAGCAAGAIQNGGQGCAAGAAGGIAQSILAGSLSGTQLSDEQQQKFAKIVGAFSGFLFSGGDGSNVSIAAHIAESGLRNNRLLHRSEIEWIEEKADEFRNWMCENHGKCSLTLDEAKGILAAETLKGVSESFDLHRVAFGDEARAFIETNYNGPASVDGQTMFGQLERGSSEYRQELINADTLLNRVGIYELASSQSRWPQGQNVTQAALQEVLAEYAENGNSPQAVAFLDAVASNPGRAKLMFAAYGSAKSSLVPVLASDFGIQNLIGDLPDTMQAEVRLAYVKGLTSKLDLTDEEVQAAILNAKWGPLLTAGFEELLEGVGILGPGMSLATNSFGQTIVRDANGVEYKSINQANYSTNVPRNFSNKKQLDEHFAKHGGEFDANSSEEYLEIAQYVQKNGTPVQYQYKGETRVGYAQYMGNNRKGQAKFAFVGTNSDGHITTLHVKSGKDFWKTINGDKDDKVIRPYNP